MGKSTISMAIFHSYVKLPEGKGYSGSHPQITLRVFFYVNLQLVFHESATQKKKDEADGYLRWFPEIGLPI